MTFRFVAIPLLASLCGVPAVGVSASPPTHPPRVVNSTSSNWAGYVAVTNLAAPQPGTVNAVSGSWTVPSVTCNSSNTYSSAWVGIDGDADRTVEQTGTEQDCINGQPSYYAWYELYPKQSGTLFPVKAGDAMTASVTYDGNNLFTLTLDDTTSRQSQTITARVGDAQRSSAEWIVEAPYMRFAGTGILPLADFGTITFSSATASLSGPVQYDPLSIVANNTTYACPTSFTGTSFSVQYGSSCGGGGGGNGGGHGRGHAYGHH